MPAGLNVSFIGDETESTAYNGAEVLQEGTIDGTTISGLSVKLVPGSYVETEFSVINNNEDANIQLSNVSPNLFDENSNYLYDFKLVHYVDEFTTREISFKPLFLNFGFENSSDTLSYLRENFTSDELTDFGSDFALRDLENEPLEENEYIQFD